MATNQHDHIREQILAALRHPEAEEGLYFRNFFHLHEEDERPSVLGAHAEILAALEELVAEGLVSMLPSVGSEDERIFSLAR